MRRGSTGAGGLAARRICVLAVLAPLSVAATVGLVRPDGTSLQPAAIGAPPTSADTTTVPQLPDGVQAPASVTDQPGTTTGLGVAVDVRALATDAIPARALGAYQRAESVMSQADPSCHVSWQLVAAIGKVESNHGRFGGALMTDDGVVHPAILGPRLTGSPGTSRILDTDAGLLDGDKQVDRAVGPMQFIPSTWAIVGVDADGDGRRDPQDIDDAALAAAVYLCGGSDDLSSVQGQRRSVHRYNHSSAYVDLVLRVMAGYLRVGPGYTGVVGALAGPGYTGFELPPVDTGTAHIDAEPVPGHPTPTFEVMPSDGPTSTSTPTATATATHDPERDTHHAADPDVRRHAHGGSDQRADQRWDADRDAHDGHADRDAHGDPDGSHRVADRDTHRDAHAHRHRHAHRHAHCHRHAHRDHRGDPDGSADQRRGRRSDRRRAPGAPHGVGHLPA